MKKAIFLSVCLFFTASALYAQSSGRITGNVINIHTDKPVPNVLIKVQGTQHSQFSSEQGTFRFSDLPPKVYQLIAIKENYYITVVPKVTVESGKITKVKVDMVVGEADAYVHMSLGGVTITEDRLLVPEDHQSTHKVSSGEIEHMQATSLRDVLDLIPGVVRGENDVPGLARDSKARLRGAGNIDPWSLFGTQVIVDDIPLSNNANRQSGKGVGYGSKVNPSANTGVDLRTVVADNIESVEVMPGVASVEYGDFTDGIVKVKTKTGELPHRIKVKNNPDTRDFSLMGGKRIGSSLVNYTFNYAYSERDLRREGDEVKRLNGEVKLRNRYLKEDELTITHKFKYNQLFVNDQDPNDPLRSTAYNRDYTLSYGGRMYWTISPTFNIESVNYIRYTRRKSKRKNLVKNVDLKLVHGNDVTGTYLPEDTLAGAYLSEVKTLGREYNIGVKLQSRYTYGETPGWKHEILSGLEYNYDANEGEGKVFDPLRPPIGTFTIRPYSFDQEPGYSSLSFYMEDKIEVEILRPLKLTLGFRYDLYNPYRLFGDNAVIASRQGNFFNPRAGLLYEIFPKTQLRLSYGRASKRPSLDIIYKEPYFVDLMDIGMVEGDSVQLVSTYRYERKNPDIKGYQQDKYSVGLDQNFGKAGLSLTGYYQKSDGIPRQQTELFMLHHYYYPDFIESPQQRLTLDTLLIRYTSVDPYHNIKWVKKYGLEFSLRTRRISPLNTKFRISAAYNYQTSNHSGSVLSSGRVIDYANPNTGKTEELTIYPIFKPTQGWFDEVVVNYYLDYVAKSLGIWVTLSAQNVLMKRKQYYPDNTSIHAVGFESIYGTTSITEQEAEEYDLIRHLDPHERRVIKEPGDKWLFSLNVSKSLFPGTEISLYVINIFNDMAWYVSYTGHYRKRNPEIYYGVEFSSQLDNLWRMVRQ